MKSLLYAVNTSSQDVAIGGTVNFGTAIRRIGNCVDVSGGNATIACAGYYDVDAEVTVTSTAAGTAILTLYGNGIAIPGAVSTFTLAANGSYTIPVDAIVKSYCPCSGPYTITAVLTGTAVTVSNATIKVTRA